MKTMRKLLLVLLALTVVLAFAGAALAEEATTAPADTSDPGIAPVIGAAATENPVPEGYSIGLFVLDGEGNTVTEKGGFSCLGSSVTLYIKHDYQIVAKYYNSKGETIEPDEELILGVEDESGNITLEHNKLILAPADNAYTFTIKMLDPSKEEGYTSSPVSVKRFKFEFTDIFAVAVGVYVIVTAIRGSGALINDEFIKEDKKELFKKLSRILSVAAGLMFIASAVLGVFFSYCDWVFMTRYILFGVGILCLLALLIMNSIFTDKEKRDKAQQTARTGGGNASKAAFEFDGTEPTIDDVLADIEKQKNTENKE